MNEKATHNPGVGAWFVLNVLSVATPTLILLLVCVAKPEFMQKTFEAVVGYSFVLLIAFTIFASTVGTLVFQRVWPGAWELVEAIVLGLILLGAIGAGVYRYVQGSEPPADLTQYAVWFSIQLAILLGVVFYCSALTSWRLRRFDDALESTEAELRELEQEKKKVENAKQQELVAAKEQLERVEHQLGIVQAEKDELRRSQQEEVARVRQLHVEKENVLTDDLHGLTEQYSDLRQEYDQLVARSEKLKQDLAEKREEVRVLRKLGAGRTQVAKAKPRTTG